MTPPTKLTETEFREIREWVERGMDGHAPDRLKQEAERRILALLDTVDALEHEVEARAWRIKELERHLRRIQDECPRCDGKGFIMVDKHTVPCYTCSASREALKRDEEE